MSPIQPRAGRLQTVAGTWIMCLALALTSPRAHASTNQPVTDPEGPRPAPEVDISSTDGPKRGACRRSPSCVRIAALSGVTSGLGLSATIVGAAMLATPDRIDPQMPMQARSYTRPGTILLSLGISVLATGVVMALAAARAARHRRTSQATARRG